MKFAYFTPSSFRTVNAGALRNVGLAKALVLAGHEVTIICADHTLDEISKQWEPILKGSKIGVVQGGSSRGSGNQLFARLVRFLEGPTSDLRGRFVDTSPDCLLLYNAAPVSLFRLSQLARRHKVPLVVDVTEWLNLADSPGGRFSPLAIVQELTMYTLAWRRSRYLTISKTMAARVGRRGPKALVVPPLFEISPTHLVRTSAHRTHLVTTGTDLRARGKDIVSLSLIVAALADVDPEGREFHLDVVGAYSQETRAYISQHLSTRAYTLHGLLSWNETLSVVQSADFSVVLRDQLDRRSNLGFPSKVPESLLLGTPILGNIFSDLSAHLEDGANAVVVRQPTKNALIQALRRLPIDIDRKAIRQEALMRYTPEAWSEVVSQFLVEKP